MDVDTFESWCDRGGKSTVGKWLAAFWKISGVSNKRVGPRGNRMILSADKLVFVALEKKPLEIPVAIPSKKGPPSKFSTGNYDLLWSIPSIHLEFFVFFNQVEFISSCFSPSIDGNYEYRAFGFLDNLIVIKLCELFANFHNFLLTFSQFCKFIELCKLCKKLYISITWLILQVCKLWDFVNFNFIILLTL